MMYKFEVVCHTNGCENGELAIVIDTPDEVPVVMCGPCGQEITDVTAV